MNSHQSLIKIYETICILAFFSLSAGLWFGIPMLIYVALILLFLIIFAKKAASWISWGWLQFAHFIGTVNTKIILTLIFYLILTPLAFCYRLFHGDFMKIKQKPLTSNWHTRDHTYNKSDLEKAW